MDKQEREKLVAYFNEQFEIKHGHVPTMRRTKSGAFMFDEGLPTKIIIDGGCLAHYAHFMNK